MQAESLLPSNTKQLDGGSAAPVPDKEAAAANVWDAKQLASPLELRRGRVEELRSPGTGLGRATGV